MQEFKLIVAGGRDFDDYMQLSKTLISLAETELADYAVSIVSGMARGADALAVRFTKEHNVKLYEFPADWQTYGKRAGYIRNAQMGSFADGLLAFLHVNPSRGTSHMISYMRSLNKPVHVVRYGDNESP